MPCSLQLVFLKYTIKSASAERGRAIWIFLRSKKKKKLPVQVSGINKQTEIMPENLYENMAIISFDVN